MVSYGIYSYNFVSWPAIFKLTCYPFPGYQIDNIIVFPLSSFILNISKALKRRKVKPLKKKITALINNIVEMSSKEEYTHTAQGFRKRQ